MEISNLLIIGSGVIAMIYARWKTSWISKQDEGTDRMQQIGARDEMEDRLDSNSPDLCDG